MNVLKYDRKLGVEVLDIIWPRRNYINVTDDWRRKRDWAGCLRLETRDKDRNTITNTNTKAKATNKTNTKQKANTKQKTNTKHKNTTTKKQTNYINVTTTAGEKQKKLRLKL